MTQKNVNLKVERGIKIKGRVRVQVVDSKTGRVKRDNGWQPNLILNQGLESPSLRQWPACFTHATCGTGTTPTQDDSGVTTANQVGTAVSLSGGSFVFNSGNVGDIIKWDTNEEARITAYIDPTNVTVTPSASVSAAEFTLYRASQTGLASETAGKRTSTYLPGAGNSETVYTPASGLMQMRRTYDFTTEVGSITYNEIGISHTATVAANLFARILLSVPASLVAGDQLRVIYELQLTLTPFAPRAISPTITGWVGVAGSEMCETFGIGEVSSTGTSTTDGADLNDPVVAARAFMSNSTTALQANPSSGLIANRNGTTFVSKAVGNSISGAGTLVMTMTKSVTFGITEGNMTGIRSIALVYNPTGSTFYVGHAFLLDSPQDKVNTFSLALSWKLVWSRTLS